ncbi:MAG: gamma-glutamyl-gamma-aminobutyrate hydrolase family protein [Terriglobia bacterium]
MQSVWVLQHTPSETLGTIADALRGHQIGFHYIETHVGQAVPAEMTGKAGLIVMGGPMGVYEQAKYPFLRDEMRLIESALKSGRPVLGVCLGSQLLAAALGAEVKKGTRKELGWHAVKLSESAAQDPLFAGVPPEFWPFHWHGDVFSLPKQAVGLASSQQTPCQAFRYGRSAYGILFHLEVTREQVAQMLLDFADELREAGGEANAITEETPRHLPVIEEVSGGVFARWASLLPEV